MRSTWSAWMAEPAASARVSSRSPRVNPSDSPIPLTRPGTPSPDGRSRIRTTGGSGMDRVRSQGARGAVSPPLTWRESAATPRVAPWSRWTTRATRSCRVSCGWTCAPRSRPSRCSPPATSRSASTATEPGPSAPSGWSRRRCGSSRTGPELFARAAKMCEYQDYVNLKLTGRYCASANNVAVRWHFVDGKPPTSLLAKLGMPELAEKWPKDVVQMGHAVGAAVGGGRGAPGPRRRHPGGAGRRRRLRRDGRPRYHRPGQLALITGSSHLHLGVTVGRVPRPGDMGHVLRARWSGNAATWSRADRRRRARW